jgi:predicted transcriptional regulator
MGKEKIKIQLVDADGDKYNLSLEGWSKTKVVKILDALESSLKSNEKDPNPRNNTELTEKENLASVGSKIWNVVEQKFPYNTFTSTDILEVYKDDYQESILLSVVATYLSRYSQKGKLSRTKKGKEWVYKILMKQTTVEERHRETFELHDAPSQQFAN